MSSRTSRALLPRNRARTSGGTPPPLRSSPSSHNLASTQNQKNEWFTPLKPISRIVNFRGSSPKNKIASQVAGNPTLSQTEKGPPPATVYDSDEEHDEDIQSSSDDGSGTTEQQEGKRLRRERRRAHREYIRNLRMEKKQIHARVAAAIFKCDDVLNDDLSAQKEEAMEVRQRVSELVIAYQEVGAQSGQQLLDIQSWFNGRSDGEATVKENPVINFEEFNAGQEHVNEMLTHMSKTRESAEHKAHLMMDLALSLVNNDDSKKMLHEQQIRFVAEISSLVKSLERVESHAKGLTQNNMDLRLQLRQTQEEMQARSYEFVLLYIKRQQITAALTVHNLCRLGRGSILRLKLQKTRWSGKWKLLFYSALRRSGLKGKSLTLLLFPITQ